MEENRNESVNDFVEYILENYKDNTIEEPSELYDDKKDFTSSEAWIKCREVKLFFYY